MNSRNKTLFTHTYTHSRKKTHAHTSIYIHKRMLARFLQTSMHLFGREEENICFVLLVLISWHSWIHLNLCLKKVKERNINGSYNNHKNNIEAIKDNVNCLNFLSTFTQLFLHWTTINYNILVNCKERYILYAVYAVVYFLYILLE